MAKLLEPSDRAKFIRLSKACANPDQMKRITARLTLNRFVNAHGKDICQATYDDIMKRRKR